MQGIREQHEEQIQQILAETKDKIEFYRNKFTNDSDHVKQIEVLQASLNEKETDKQKALVEFQSFKQGAEQRELNLKSEFSQRINDLTCEVSSLKRDFDLKVQSIETLREQYEKDKKLIIEDLTEKHRQELETFLESQQGKEGDLLKAKRELEKQYESQLQELQDKLAQLSDAKDTACREYDEKLAKAQAFYEKELEALRTSHSADAEQRLQALREQHEKMKQDFAFTEKQLQSRVSGLVDKLSLSEEQVERLRTQLEKLQQTINDRDSSSATLAQQVRTTDALCLIPS